MQETLDEIVHCIPGSPVRFVFSNQEKLVSSGLLLKRVEVDISLLPSLASNTSLPLHLHSSLATSDLGVSELEKAGHIVSLIEMTFGQEAILEGRNEAIRTMSASKKKKIDIESLEKTSSRLSKRRASLWALASICAASQKGLESALVVCPDMFLRLDAAARGLTLRFLPDKAAAMKGAVDLAIQKGSFEAIPDSEEDVSFRAAVLTSLSLFSKQKVGASVLETLGWVCSSSSLLPLIPATAMSLVEEKPKILRVDDEIENLVVVPFLHSSRRPTVAEIALGIGNDGLKAIDILLAGIRELGSRVHIKEARILLLKLRSDYPTLFSNSAAFSLAHSIAASLPLGLGARRFISYLFREVSFHEKNWQEREIKV